MQRIHPSQTQPLTRHKLDPIPPWKFSCYRYMNSCYAALPTRVGRIWKHGRCENNESVHGTWYRYPGTVEAKKKKKKKTKRNVKFTDDVIPNQQK